MKTLLLGAVATLHMATTYAQASAADHPDKAVAGYFDNSQVFRDKSGAVFEIINFRADHTMRLWRDAAKGGSGTWREGKWVVNTGQDNTILCHWPDDVVPMKTWCHGFAPDKKVGDRWINPDKNGHAQRSGGIPIVQKDGKWVRSDAPDKPLPDDVVIFTLEKGLVEPPARK